MYDKPNVHAPAMASEEGIDQCVTIGDDCEANCFAKCLEEATPLDLSKADVMSQRDSYLALKRVIVENVNDFVENNPE